MWVMHIYCEGPPPLKIRQGRITHSPTIQESYRKMRNMLRILHNVDMKHVTGKTVEHGADGAKRVTFNAAGHFWQYHLYKESVGVEKLRDFQPIG